MKKILSKLRYAIQSKFLAFFSHIKVHPYPLWITIEPTTFELKGRDYYDIRSIIQPGDIILRGFKHYLDGYFIPGTFSHAAIYIGGKDEAIIHSMTPEVQYTDLATFTRADKIAIIRFDELKKDDIETIITRAKSKLGTPYDYDFIFEEEDTPDRLFSCSELVYYIMKPFQSITGWKLSEATHLLGLVKREEFLPDDALPSHETNGKIVWLMDK